MCLFYLLDNDVLLRVVIISILLSSQFRITTGYHRLNRYISLTRSFGIQSLLFYKTSRHFRGDLLNDAVQSKSPQLYVIKYICLILFNLGNDFSFTAAKLQLSVSISSSWLGGDHAHLRRSTVIKSSKASFHI